MDDVIRKSLEDYSMLFGVDKAKLKLEEYKQNRKKYSGQYVFWENEHLFKIIEQYFEKGYTEICTHNLDYMYNTWSIKKSNGGVRLITSPEEHLKKFQQFINKYILKYADISIHAHGYVKNKSIVTNAIEHCNKKVVICMDIRDFFSSIRGDQVYDVFINLGYTKEISKILTTFCTYKDRLAVGAPTSPSISNAILKNIDLQLDSIANLYGFKYTRYADDITFSSNESKIGYKKFISTISQLLSRYGFEVNCKKTKIYTRKGKQEVTGLIVNQGLKVKSKIKKNIKKELYYCNKFGVYNHVCKKYLKRKFTSEDEYNLSDIEELKKIFIQYITGKINFVKLVEPYEGKVLEKEYIKIINKSKGELGNDI